MNDFTIDMREYLKIFKALSDENRLRILCALEIRDLFVCEISALLGLADSTVSKHLSVLSNADLIVNEKRGRWVRYKLNDKFEAEYSRTISALLLGWIRKEPEFNTYLEKVEKLNINCCP